MKEKKLIYKDLTRKTTISPRPPPPAPPLLSQLRRVFFMTFLMLTIGGMGKTLYLVYKDSLTEEREFQQFLQQSRRVDLHGNPMPGREWKVRKRVNFNDFSVISKVPNYCRRWGHVPCSSVKCRSSVDTKHVLHFALYLRKSDVFICSQHRRNYDNLS